MTKCFEFKYFPGEIFINENEAWDIEEFVKFSGKQGLIVESPRVVDGYRTIRVRCNTPCQNMVFNLRFLGSGLNY